MPCRVAHLGCLGWREGGGSELVKSRLRLWSLLQAEAFSHMLSPHIYPLQSIWIQMSITMCLHKCPRDMKYLLEMSIQFLNKIRHLCSPSHEKGKKPLLLKFSQSHWFRHTRVMGQITGHCTEMRCVAGDLWKDCCLEKASLSFQQLNVAILSDFFRKAHACYLVPFCTQRMSSFGTSTRSNNKQPSMYAHMHATSQGVRCIASVSCCIKIALVQHGHHIIFNILVWNNHPK